MKRISSHMRRQLIGRLAASSVRADCDFFTTIKSRTISHHDSVLHWRHSQLACTNPKESIPGMRRSDVLLKPARENLA